MVRRCYQAHTSSSVHTITLRESASISPKSIIVHSLHHRRISSQIVSHIVMSPSAMTTTTTSSPAIPQAINLFLPVFRRLLRFREFVLQLLYLSILLRIAHFLLVLFALIRYAVIQAHGRRKCADQRRRQRGHNEGFLVDILARAY
jgi:hypothetical protein